MHSMSESATITARARQVAERREHLARRARELAVEHGIQGFTIDGLCEDVGLSRRTFFNHFPSKEQAVLGRPEEGLEGEAVARFLAGGGAPGRVSDDLPEALADLAIEHFEAIGLTPERAHELVALLEREPKLLAALLKVGSERDRLLERLAAEREGLEPGDPRLRLAVQLVGTVARLSVEEALTAESPVPFPEILRARLAEARALFAPAAPTTPEEDR